MSFTQRDPDVELPKEILDILRFLIKDQAFDVEFLVTAIQEYYQKNRPKSK